MVFCVPWLQPYATAVLDLRLAVLLEKKRARRGRLLQALLGCYEVVMVEELLVLAEDLTQEGLAGLQPGGASRIGRVVVAASLGVVVLVLTWPPLFIW
jgi:hypothetical protein